MRRLQPIAIALLLGVWGPAVAAEPTVTHELEGYASWYAGKFQGRLTANGEVFDTNLLTAAHKTLPFGTIVEVVHLETGRSVEVRINDRGPFVEGRVIDLSRAAAERIVMTAEGIAPVRLRLVSVPAPPKNRIQIASFSARANAERTRSRLRAAGVEAQIEATASVYRVVVPEVEPSETDEVVARLADLGFPSVLVRKER